MKFFDGLRRGIAAIQDAILVSLLSVMILLATAQVFLDKLDIRFSWIEQSMPMLVMWLGLTGAVVASRIGRHVTIDLLGRLLKGRALASVSLITATFTTVICVLLAWHGGRLVMLDMDGGGFGVAGIPNWFLESIIPLAFGLMALSHFADAGSSVISLTTGRPVDTLSKRRGGAR